jgi:hypothetical protein
MRFPRFLVTTVSVCAYPASILFVTAGITFTAIEVFAETGPPYRPCSSNQVTTCYDAGLLAMCSGCSTSDCSCFPAYCSPESTARPEIRFTCLETPLCSQADYESCAGKAEDEPCTQTAAGPVGAGETAACKPNSCFVRGDGAYVIGGSLQCRLAAPAPLPEASTSDSSTPGNGNRPAATPSAASDSGCTTVPGSSSPATVVLAPAPLGLLLLGWCLRRRERRKA